MERPTRGCHVLHGLCSSSTGEPELVLQHLNMLLSRMGLVVVFLVVGSLPRAASRWLCWEEKGRLIERVHTGEKEGGEDKKLVAVKKLA